ncbi:MAG TPA: thiamine phosphate synthase [Pyrinomonadaceae bacterium]|nr:thiamine phosphate synthase [Pyrinomonadaceae bacterium]
MPLDLPLPIIYPITNGNILRLVEAAVAAGVPLFQIREKLLSGRVLYELVERAVEITRGSNTRLLVNDRPDIARAAGADGVHLTTQSLPADVVRRIYGPEFLIGVSTHSSEEARVARVRGADFVVFGPVFATESKREFGAPQGLERLQEITNELRGFPVVAIGGITLDNVAPCFDSGASGVAAIRLFSDAEKMSSVVEVIRSVYR